MPAFTSKKYKQTSIYIYSILEMIQTIQQR